MPFLGAGVVCSSFSRPKMAIAKNFLLINILHFIPFKLIIKV